jgi:hypothetical protein
MGTSDPGGVRTFNTADPDEHERLRLAWESFQYMLDTPGVVASDLDPRISTTSSPTSSPSATGAWLRSNPVTRSERPSHSGPAN